VKVFLGIAAVVLIAFSIAADYAWKRWMAARRRERDRG